MRTFAFVAPIVALLAAAVTAEECTTGRNYCGEALRDKDWDFEEKIEQALMAAGHPSWTGDGALFYCADGEDGIITFIEGCVGGCEINEEDDDDPAKSDSCRV